MTEPRLGAVGNRLVDEMKAAYEFNAAEERLLLEAPRTADELEDMQKALTKAKVVVRGSTGQDKAHPLFEEVRRHRAALAALVKQLEPTRESRGAEVSEAARAAAVARWQKRGGELRVAH